LHLSSPRVMSMASAFSFPLLPAQFFFSFARIEILPPPFFPGRFLAVDQERSFFFSFSYAFTILHALPSLFFCIIETDMRNTFPFPADRPFFSSPRRQLPVRRFFPLLGPLPSFKSAGAYPSFPRPVRPDIIFFFFLRGDVEGTSLFFPPTSESARLVFLSRNPVKKDSLFLFSTGRQQGLLRGHFSPQRLFLPPPRLRRRIWKCWPFFSFSATCRSIGPVIYGNHFLFFFFLPSVWFPPVCQKTEPKVAPLSSFSSRM